MKVTTVMGSYRRPWDDGNFRANKGGRGNFEAKENPEMEIMIQDALCEIGRFWYFLFNINSTWAILYVEVGSVWKGKMNPIMTVPAEPCSCS